MGKHKRDRSKDHHKDVLKRIYYLEKELANRRETGRQQSRSRSGDSRSISGVAVAGRSRHFSRERYARSNIDYDGRNSCNASSENLGGHNLRDVSPNSTYQSGRNTRGSTPGENLEGYTPSEVDSKQIYNYAKQNHGSRNPCDALPQRFTGNNFNTTDANLKEATTPMELDQNGIEDIIIINNDVELSEDTLKILGEDPSKTKLAEFKYHEALASIWTHNITSGLPKGEIESLWNEHAVYPKNCGFDPPQINPEVKVNMSRPHLLRDNTHMQYQNEIGKGLNALGKALNVLLEEDPNIPKEIKQKVLTNMVDAGKIFTNLFNNISHNRRRLILPNLDKQVQQLVEKVPPGEHLFGPDLGEKTQKLKSVVKLGSQLRPTLAQYKFAGSTNFRSGFVKKGGGPISVHKEYVSNPLNKKRPMHSRREMQSQKGLPSKGERYYTRQQKRR